MRLFEQVSKKLMFQPRESQRIAYKKFEGPTPSDQSWKRKEGSQRQKAQRVNQQEAGRRDEKQG
jgi:hypothetical protein